MEVQQMEPTINAKGSSVFVAGGTSGINLGIAEGFAQAGARVAVMSRDQAKVDHAVEKLRSLGCDAMGAAADVRDYEATAKVLELVHAEFGDLDVVVSGAAGNFLASAVGMSPKAFRAVVEIDLIGTYHVLRAAYPTLRKPGAVVINISASQATMPMALQFSRMCREGGCRDAYSRARLGVGSRWNTRQRRSSGSDSWDRRHETARAH
jgi:NAD(P)-dependent dehydrogenase (short-subunit alcohol dehydrogenase family)